MKKIGVILPVPCHFGVNGWKPKGKFGDRERIHFSVIFPEAQRTGKQEVAISQDRGRCEKISDAEGDVAAPSFGLQMLINWRKNSRRNLNLEMFPTEIIFCGLLCFEVGVLF
jgi:hypothetical protein